MLYQLPNGKVIRISIEEFLDLSDQDIQYLMSVNAGEYPSGMWQGSSIKKDNEYEELDKSIDYTPEDEENSDGGFIVDEGVDLDDLPDED